MLLEAISIVLLVGHNAYQRSRIVSFNRQLSGFLYQRVDGVRAYLSLREVNEGLAEENTRLRNALSLYDQLTDSALVKTDSLQDYRYSYMPARVIQNSVFKQYNYMTIDRGREAGVFRDMGVVSDQGLVGIVLESSDHFATVIPIVNRDFRLSVKILSNNYAGILQWDGNSPLHADLHEIPFHVTLTEGDTVVTSGFSSIFPQGIRVGVIESFSLDQGNFYNIRIRLFTQFQQLFRVDVIRNFRQEEQRTLESNTD
ncbi:MAG: rod shape-determining protein MreC [Bacteroidales bacterium]